MPHVQFSDNTETRIISVFSCPQDEDIYPHQGMVDEEDSRYKNFINPPLSAAQVAMAAGASLLANGINIVSTSTGALSGVYSLTERSQSDINAVATYIALNDMFPQAQATTYWADKSGAIHQFPSVAVFKAFATAVADFVDAVEDYQNSGGEFGALPSPNVTIP